MENGSVATDKKLSTKKILVLFLLILFLGVFLIIYLNKEKLVNLVFGNKAQVRVDDTNVSTSLNEDDNSPFAKFFEQDQNSDETYSPYTPQVTSNLEKAMVYDINIRTYRDSWDKILEDGDFVVEVVLEGDKKLYKLIYSKNSFIDHSSNDYLKFNPTIDSPKSLVVIEGSSIDFDFEDSDIEGGFENTILELGDKVVFRCRQENCEDGLLSWVLIIKK